MGDLAEEIGDELVGLAGDGCGPAGDELVEEILAGGISAVRRDRDRWFRRSREAGLEGGDVFALDRVAGETDGCAGRRSRASRTRACGFPPGRSGATRHQRQARASGWVRARELAGGLDERGEDFRAVEIVDAAGVAFDVSRAHELADLSNVSSSFSGSALPSHALSICQARYSAR
jgi:hypothetical protein